MLSWPVGSNIHLQANCLKQCDGDDKHERWSWRCRVDITQRTQTAASSLGVAGIGSAISVKQHRNSNKSAHPQRVMLSFMMEPPMLLQAWEHQSTPHMLLQAWEYCTKVRFNGTRQSECTPAARVMLSFMMDPPMSLQPTASSCAARSGPIFTQLACRIHDGT